MLLRRFFSLHPPFFLFAFFTVSHWFGVNAFWMPLGVCRGVRRGGPSVAEWRNLNVKQWGGGLCGWRPKARHSSENWSGLQSWGTSPSVPPPLLPPLSFSGSLLYRQPTGALSIFLNYIQTMSKTNIISLAEKMERIVSNSLQIRWSTPQLSRIQMTFWGQGLVGF